MKKFCFLLVLGIIIIMPCFSQNMLFIGGDCSFTKPKIWNAGIGFNMIVFKPYIQNDAIISFGQILEKPESSKNNILFISDKLYYLHDWKWIGIRAGAFASIGIFGFSGIPQAVNIYAGGGGFLGICILPKSLISVTLDACAGYSATFRLAKNPAFTVNERGYLLSLSLAVRLNLDKL